MSTEVIFTRRYRKACELAMSHGTPWRAAKLAAVVGTLLVLINQWGAVTGPAPMDWLKVLLTYCVPYLVSTYTSVSKDLYLLGETEAAELTAHHEAQKIRGQ
ncbi:MAG: nitrate/nitrite transporter NrtS [Marinobacter sp.]|uniref:nitrate/nitrite transporter NrtS n=1 Tax=Gammaproteobacteria TaxID=1236 RepID=UPI003F94B1B4